MTQEEKLKEAKRLYETANADQRYVLESLFPELRESEDERIRKEIMRFIFDYPQKLMNRDSWLAWLEKQGEHYNFCKKIQVGDHVTRNEDGVLVNLSQLKRVAKKDEQILANSAKTCKDEQKPADKVEPKFKVGDWISGYYTNYKVTAINSEGYAVEDIDGNKINILFENEKFHHLWTIEDAKDGDVLATENFIFIFKNIDNSNGVHYYCHYEISKYEDLNQFSVALPQSLMGRVGNSISHYSPASKEQCDLLFQKMKESGYEWDAEKKELKKIEKKPAAWSKKDARLLDNCISLIEDIDCTEKEQNWLKGIKDRIQPQPKQEWSEEDEEHINSLLERLEGMCKKDTTFIRTRFAVSEDEDWIKSLKYRVQSQLKQEWSEEDDRMCKAIIDNIKAICKEGYFVGNIDSGELINFLESLRFRNRWKPSDEQMFALNIAIEMEDGDILKSLHNDLKKLKEE